MHGRWTTSFQDYPFQIHHFITFHALGTNRKSKHLWQLTGCLGADFSLLKVHMGKKRYLRLKCTFSHLWRLFRFHTCCLQLRINSLVFVLSVSVLRGIYVFQQWNWWFLFCASSYAFLIQCQLWPIMLKVLNKYVYMLICVL